MAGLQAKEQEVQTFLKKCNDLINQRANVPNFDEVADLYLAEGEKIEDDVDAMLNDKPSYSQEQLSTLHKLKVDIGIILDKLESVDAPSSLKNTSTTFPMDTTAVPPTNNTTVPPISTSTTIATTALAPTIPTIPQQTPLQTTLATQPTYNSTESMSQTVPVTYSQPPMQIKEQSLSFTNKSGNEIWEAIKNVQTTTADYLFGTFKETGAFPNGFRPSFLQKVLSLTDDLYTYTNFLAPKATPHHLSFKDAAFGSAVGKILNNAIVDPRHLKIMSITGCFNMVNLNVTACEVVDRILRVCLVDGERIISNIHTIRATANDPEKRHWQFDNTNNDSSVGLNSGEMFLKCDSRSRNVSLLFECAYIVRRQGVSDTCMISCGWFCQRLVDANNNEPIRKGNFEGLLHGGYPMEYGIAVGNGPAPPQITTQKPQKSGVLKSSKEPYITLKLMEYNLDRELVDTMPDTLIGCILHLSSIDFYCDALIAMLGKREHPQWAGRVHNPFLSTFPAVADRPDILDVVRTLWLESFKKLSRQEKKDDQLIRTKFVSTYLSLAIPALGSVVLGCKFNWQQLLSYPQLFQARRDELNAMLDSLRRGKSPFQLPSVSFRPLKQSEYTLDLKSPNSFAVVS